MNDPIAPLVKPAMDAPCIDVPYIDTKPPPPPNARRAPELVDVLRSIRASRLSDADKEKICSLLTLIEIPAERMTREQLRQAREAAGLSIGQAARLLQVTRGILADIEAGVAGGVRNWPPDIRDRMNRVYRLGPEENCP